VHGYWTLARVLRRFPDLPEADAIRSLFDEQFTDEKVAGEVAYLARPSARGFERPYGWAWALKLQSELLLHKNGDGERWSRSLQPFADAFVQRFKDFLPLATYPIRSGVHSSTSFALTLALNYAHAVHDAPFENFLAAKASEWHINDEGVTVNEPSQSDFLSPTLMEAALMRTVFAEGEFRAWFAKFLPKIPDVLLTPATVTDRSDGQIAHLDGLNLSRAWCWRLIRDAMVPTHPALPKIDEAIGTLLSSALGHIAGDYMGEHWLASFALLALDPYAA
jgi:hypothetical protein